MPVVGPELVIPFTVGGGGSEEPAGVGESMLSMRDRFPLRLLIGGEDCTFLLSENFTFSSVDPGGYEMASFPIPRDLPQVLRGMPVKLDCGLQVAWEGRVKEVQRSLGSKTLIQCEGYGARLRDETLSMVYVDRDLTRWGSPSIPRNLLLAAANYSQYSSNVGPDTETNLPALIQAITGAWASPLKPAVEAWYDAGPENLIAAVYYALTSNAFAEGAAFSQQLALSPTQEAATLQSTGNVHPKSSALLNPAIAMRYAVASFFYPETPAGAAGFEYQSLWKSLAVYGNHGLTLRGSAPYGLYPSDIVKHAISTVPGLTVGVIPETSFYTVPHAAYYSPVEVQQVLADMAKLVGYHWGVWESLTYLTGNASPRVDFRPYPAQGSPTAFAWRRECETLDIREDLSAQYNIANVSFSDAAGTESVVTVKVDNPALDVAGIKQRVIPLSLQTSTPAAAETYGKLALELLQQQARVVGSAVIRQPIHKVNGAPMAPWMLKAGLDRIRVPDLPSSDVWGVNNELPITRVECSGGPDGMTTSVEFGQGPNLLEALTSELAQAAVLAG